MFNNPTDKNTPNPNNNPTPSLFGNQAGSTQNKTAGGLFGSGSSGLFGTGTGGGGLFSNAASSQLKTSERKQGGLFSSLSTSKPFVSQQAPKLTFGGLGNPNPTSGGLFSSNAGGKKQQTPSAGSLFSNKPQGSSLFSGTPPSGGLFGNPNQPTNAPTGGLFGNKQQPSNAATGGLFGNIQPESKPKETAKPTFLQSGGLFSAATQQKKQEKPITLFGETPTGLFGSTTQNTTPTGGLFSGGEKKQGGLFGSTAQSKLFSKQSQPIGSSTLFGGVTKKQEQKKFVQSGLFGSTNLPTSSLFGKSAQSPQQTTQAPKFSLTGNITSGPVSTGNDGLFNKVKKTEEQKPQMTPKEIQVPKPTVSGLFGGVPPITKPAQQATPKLSASPLFGSNTQQGGLFSQQKKPETNKPIQTPGGLFSLSGKQKKQPVPLLIPPSLAGSLFSQKKQQTQKQQVKTSGGLFQGPSNLFGKNAQQKPDITQKSSSLFSQTNQTKQKKQTPRILQPLISTSQKLAVPAQKTPLFGKATQQSKKQKSRTISFNEPQEMAGKKNTQNKVNENKKPSGGLFNLGTSTKDTEKTAQETVKLAQGKSDLRIRFNPDDLSKKQEQKKQVPTIPPAPPKQPTSFFTQPSSTPKPTKPVQKIVTSLEISHLLSTQQKQIKKQELKLIQQWITLSFTRSNEIPTTQMLTKQFPLHQNQDINRFLNDLFRQVVMMVNLPFDEKSFKLINKLFDQLLDTLKIKQFLFKCTKINMTKTDAIATTQTLELVQLNNAYFTHHNMYKFTAEGIYLNLESSQVKKYLLALSKKFISNQLQYLQFIQRKTQILQLPYSLFYTLLKYSLSYNKLRLRTLPSTRQHLTQVISLVEDFEKKIITKLSIILEIFTNDNFASFQIINKQYLHELIRSLDNFSYTDEDVLIITALKVILNTIDIPSITPQSPLSSQLKTTIKQTRSLQLLPIRALATCYQTSSASTLSMISAHDLYHYISGPEWIDWLEVYLSSGMNSNQIMEREVSAIQAKYMLNVLAYPKLKKKRISRQKMSLKQTRYIQQLQKKILPKKRPICKFIHTLKQQNMLDIFYLILESLIYDYESYRRITETFFKQKDEFIYEFKVIVAEVCNYPMQQFKEEIPFLEEKMSYFLRICEVAPQKMIQVERMVFDGIKIGERKSKDQIADFGSWDVGHRICHLVIDTINYFGIRQNQLLVAKAVGCLKELLAHEFTSQAMKLAMAVNKPQLSFIINGSLLPISEKLTVQMMDLLEFFLVSEQFVNMLMINLRSNNSQQVELEKYYAVRYSVKDYKVLLAEVGMTQQKQVVFDQVQSVLYGSVKSNKGSIAIVPSSYWFLRLLQTLIRSFKQEKMSQQLEKQLLYIVNLMLERLLVPVIEGENFIIETKKSTKTQESKLEQTLAREQIITNLSKPSTTPIYPFTDQSQQISRVLLYIIQALNAIDIFPLIKEKLKYSITKVPQQQSSQQTFSIHNNLLFDSYEQNQLTVYLSVSVLRNIVSIYRHFQKIRSPSSVANIMKSKDQNAQNLLRLKNGGQNKMMYKILTKMKWLQQLQQQVFVKAISSFTSTQSISSFNYNNDLVLGLITLLAINSDQEQKSATAQQSAPLNLKLSYEKPLVVPILDGQDTKRKSHSVSMGRVQKFYSLYREQMNYQQVHDFMMVTQNKYLQGYESIETIVVHTLRQLVRPNITDITSYKLNLIKHLTFPYESALSSTTWLLQLLSTQLLSFLQSQQSSIQLKQNILSLLQSMIESSESTGGFIFAKKLFYQFVRMYQVYNKSLGQYHVENKNRMNLIIIKIINSLFDKDHYNFVSILSLDFMDQLLCFIINNSSQILLSSQSIMKSLRLFNNKYLYPKEMTYYELQTTCQQRDLIVIGDALHVLRQVIAIIEKLFFDEEIRKANQQKKNKFISVSRLSSLLVITNLPYLHVDIWTSELSTLSLDNFTNILQSSASINALPRVFTSNPLLYFIAQSTTLSNISNCFKLYKENIINYVSQKSIKLAQSSLRFLTWSLTINNTLYGNQPIKKLQLAHSKMSCASHMGNYLISAIQMFGQNQIEAACRVKQLYELSLHSLSTMSSNNKLRGYCFVQTVTLMGYCVEWLRARKDTNDTLSVLIKSTLSSTKIWLQSNTLSHPNVIKLVHSLSSISSTLNVNPSILGEIKLLITQLLSKYMQNRTMFMNESIIHELLIILINFPISIEDTETISNATVLWQNETNSQFFYNLSRLMIEYAVNVPGQLARLKVLTKCQKVSQLFNQQSNQIIPQCYHYGMRSSQSISTTWIFKLASAMMSSNEQSVLLLQQISEFYTLASKYIENLLKNIPSGNISFVYLQLLQTVSEFLLTLVSSPGWVAVNRAQFEKVTFLLSHKLINVLMDCVGGKLLVSPESEMQLRLRKQSSLMTGNAISLPQLDTTSPFKLFSDYHMLSLLNLYCKLLSQSLYNSYYVSKYFNSPVYENYRYGVSYWDRMNKSIGDMLKYGSTMKRRYQKLSQGKMLMNKLNALSDFANCSEYFVQSGYLVSLISIPESPEEFISLVDQVISTIIQLGNVHLIQQSTFRQRYQCIMKGNIQKFGNKLIDHAKILQKIYDQNQKNYASSSISTEKHQTNNYPQYYEAMCKNLNVLVKNL